MLNKARSNCLRILCILGLFASIDLCLPKKSIVFASNKINTNDTGIETARSFEKIFAHVVEQVKPAVVSITSVKVFKHQRGRQREMPNDRFHSRPSPRQEQDQFRDFWDFFGDDFLDRFFSPRYPEEDFKVQGLGSGVIIDSENGYIVTNNHVVENADELTVALEDKREFKGTIVGTDPQTDLAIIKIEGKDLPSAKLGDSESLKVGQWAIAIGNPFGLTQTVSVGVISAIGRANVGVAQYEDMIQTDAAINPGNSGGPLVDLNGEVIGINTAIFTRSGGYQGIGFAIPVNMVKAIMKDLIEKGKVTRGWLGVAIQDISPDLAESFDVAITEGVIISDVQDNSPAKEAGFERGDIVINYNGKPIRDVNHLRNTVAQTEVGKKVKVTVLRSGEEKILTVKIGEQPVEMFAAAPGGPIPEKELGITVQTLTKEIAKNLGLEDETGVIVTEVHPEGPAAMTGMREGDIIKEVNRQKITNVEEFNSAVKKGDKRKGILLLIKRGEYAQYLIVKSDKE
ncbi:MAG: DegQ family serine endoprotease [Candidatus Kuenenia sp.]|nr:DegQ family serine endoprotease [Candidatus Kuenenia hertensis]